MTLIPFSLEFYEDLVDMYHKFVMEIYGDKRRISSKYFFYQYITEKIRGGHEIVLAVNGNDVAGFSLCHIDDMSGLTEKIYFGETVYVKPEFRKTRAGYLLYNNVMERAKDLQMNVCANGRVENGVDRMIEKHFTDGSGKEKMFTMYERRK